MARSEGRGRAQSLSPPPGAARLGRRFLPFPPAGPARRVTRPAANGRQQPGRRPRGARAGAGAGPGPLPPAGAAGRGGPGAPRGSRAKRGARSTLGEAPEGQPARYATVYTRRFVFFFPPIHTACIDLSMSEMKQRYCCWFSTRSCSQKAP